jgi:hypothetical protein
MKIWHCNTRKIQMQRNVQLHNLYNKQAHGRQIKKKTVSSIFKWKKKHGQKIWITLAKHLWQINWK